MPELPIKEKPFTNTESVGNTFALQSYIDIEKDDYMDNRFRHGLDGGANNCFTFVPTGAAIDGIFDIVNFSFIAVFSAGRLFKVAGNGVVTEITGVTLNSGTPVSYADFGSTGYFCNNSRILKWNYADSTCSFIADTDAPTNAVFVGFLDQYLIALRANSARFEFSDVGLPDTWLGEFATANTRPDRATGLFTNFGEIFIPGTKTLENWADSGDPTAPFQRIPGAVEERGTRSPYTVTQIDNTYFFLDSERRVIRLAGRQPQIISNHIDNQLQEIKTITDAIGYHFNAEGSTKYVMTFPTEGKTFAYDYKLDYWAEWSYWDHTTATRENFLGRTGAYIDKWNKYLVGCRKSGKLYLASREYTTDNGTDIIPEMTTGRIDWGTTNRKSSRRLRIKSKRGYNTPGATNTPKIYFSKRDNGKNEWSFEREIDLGIAGDNNSYKAFRRLGVYRDRQYRFRMQGAPSAICSAVEDIEVLS